MWPKGLTEKSACFLAAIVCVLPLALGLHKNEKNLVKLIFFPLSFRCLSNLLMEVGLIPTFKHGDILGYMLSCFFVVYAYVCERHSSSPAVTKMIYQYAADQESEVRLYVPLWVRAKADIARIYNFK